MKIPTNKYTKKRLLITFGICIFSALLIFIGIKNIKLNSSLYNLLPYDQNMIRSLQLSQQSNISEKVMIYIDKSDEQSFENALSFINEEIANLPIKLENAIPNGNDITEIMNYFQKNSLLLYPYDQMPNPFTKMAISKGLQNKISYIQNMPFFTTNDEFFLDPTMTGLQALNFANSMTPTEYMPQSGGVVSPNNKAYLKILNCGFGTENYEKISELVKLDKKISNYAKEHKINAFVYSAHLYFWDSMKRITTEISIIFVLSIILTFLIFYIFYKNIFILLYVFMPIITSFAFTFVTIAIFKKEFGAIAFAFGSTTAGITIDYSIHYISKINLYPTLSDLRKKITMPMILGVLTTVLALAFLFFSKIVSLQEIALFGILAISYSFIFSYFIMQPLLAPTKINIDFKPINFVKPNIIGLIIWSVLTILSIVGVCFSHFENNIMMMDMKHKQLEKRISCIQQHFAESTDSTFLVFMGDTTDDVLLNNYQAFSVLHKNNIHINTPSLFLPSVKTLSDRKDFIKKNFDKTIFLECEKNSDFEQNTFSEYVNKALSIQNDSLTEMPDFLKRHILSQIFNYKDKVCIMIHVATKEQLKSIDNILSSEKIAHIIVSPTTDSSVGLVKFEKNSMKLLFLSLFVIAIILMIHFKNFIFGLLATLPMLVALLSAFAIAFWTGRGFNIMHFAASIIVLGISVDYGIYIVDAYTHNHSRKELNTTLSSMLISGLTTIAGFGVLIISSNRSIFSLGSAMFVGIIMSFITAYFLVGFICEKIFKIPTNQ